MTPDRKIEDATLTLEEVAATVGKINDAAEAMMTSGLNRRTIVWLLHRVSGVRMGDIDAVLDGMERLREELLGDNV